MRLSWAFVVFSGVCGSSPARVRDEAIDRLHQELFQILSPRQRAVLELLLEVPEGSRASDLERWHKGPSVASGKNMEPRSAGTASM